MKSVFKIIIVFVFGMAGGIFANQILLPYFVQQHLFSEYQIVQTPLSAGRQNKVTITENIALQESVEKVKKTVVGVLTKTKSGKILTGSGLVVTSDGLMITLSELIPRGEEFVFFIDGKTPGYQVLKRDPKNNLALVKLEEGNFQTCGFADFNKLKLGERVFLVGVIFEKTKPIKVVNEGIVKFFNQDYIRTNIFEKYTLAGSPLFNIKGELLGLNLIDSEGKVLSIPIVKIRHFLGL